MDFRIIQLEQEIAQNLKFNWNIEKMAEIAEVSPTHFIKLFKETTSETPIQFLRRLRLEKAKNLLEVKNSRISEIIHEVGIKDQSHFVRDFKKAFGETPTEYRQSHWDRIREEKAKAQKNG
ncbi:MAG: AraC family transcriptional regulator [Pyrinomonadaceae bacterium]|nr:AraC family transcriptional regulator [Pyrinomonadaceae bacterium]